MFNPLSYYIRDHNRLRFLKTYDTSSSLFVHQKSLALLIRTLKQAKQHSPYYQKIIPEALINDQGFSFDLFKEIPFLNKNLLGRHFNELKTGLNRGRLTRNTSGGSTGKTAVFLQDDEYRSWNRAVKLLTNNWLGLKGRYRTLILWGFRRDFIKEKNLAYHIKNLVYPEVTLDTTTLSNEHIQQYVKKINELKPDLIRGYAESLNETANYVNQKNWLAVSPRFVVSEAGTLTNEMRANIETAFKAKVINRYGSREMGIIASENGDGKGLYVSALTHFVEILNEKGQPVEPGEEGEIVISQLINPCMPLIRYRIGDTGIWANEDADRSLPYPLIKTVTGRTTDLFVCRNGSKKRIIISDFSTEALIKQCQFIQHTIDHIEVKIVLSEPLTNLHNEEINVLKQRVSSKLKTMMGDDQEISFSFVDSIPMSPSGKLQYAISKMNQV